MSKIKEEFKRELKEEELEKVAGGFSVQGDLQAEIKPPEYEKGILTIPIDPMTKPRDQE